MPMPEPHDPLRAALKDAAEAGQRAAVPSPLTVITARGDRRRRLRAALVAAACVAVCGGTAGVVAALLPEGGAPALPSAPTSGTFREGPSPSRSAADRPTTTPTSTPDRMPTSPGATTGLPTSPAGHTVTTSPAGHRIPTSPAGGGTTAPP